MKKRTIAAVALGGAALFVIPASVAFATTTASHDGPRLTHGLTLDRVFDGRQDGNQESPRSSGSADGTRTQAGMNGAGTHTPGFDAQGSMGHGASMGLGSSMGHGAGEAGLEGAALVAPGEEATDAEAASLAYMVEEEKLAHDLYVELGQAWDLNVFDNISSSEEAHTDAVRALLEAYGLEDPTAGMDAGEFANRDLQDLYDTLLAAGLASPTAALQVGGLVEETDILDLSRATSDSAAIGQVFGQLTAGSENHLRAFVVNLDRLGVTYDAQAMNDADVARILGQ